MILTVKERALIKAHRREEDRLKPKKIGYLKEDLYQFTDKIETYPTECFTYTKNEMDKLIQAFSRGFDLCLKANSAFDCYTDSGIEQWYDRAGGYVEGASNLWATKYLTGRKGVSHS